MSIFNRLIAEFNEFREEQDKNPDRFSAILKKTESDLREARENLTENIPFECENFSAAPRDRAHLVFIDGTGNDPEMDHDGSAKSASTNVYRLFRSIKQGDDQLARYYPGVGSQADDPNPVSALFRKFGGFGANRIMDTAYVQLLKDYHPGDRIYLFGYSRGAAIARMLANKLHEEGIRESGVARFVDLKHSDRLLLDKVDLAGARRDVEVIDVLGVWDTVAAFGNPNNEIELFKDLTVAENVKKVYHLLAIDEDRKPFRVTHMEPRDHIDEIWFPGVHGDIGGGYGNRDLADITLEFMRNRLEEHGIKLTRSEFPASPQADGKIHDHAKSPMPKLPRPVRMLGGQGKVRLHKSVFERMDSPATRPRYAPDEVVRLKHAGAFETDGRD